MHGCWICGLLIAAVCVLYCFGVMLFFVCLVGLVIVISCYFFALWPSGFCFFSYVSFCLVVGLFWITVDFDLVVCLVMLGLYICVGSLF